ncbi:MAG: hypothetical protein JNM24_19475 [Bdellovibrionaceae bacterium]|nr:hypothetical protein [Pseudobdellovibrionaceae bacterium]
MIFELLPFVIAVAILVAWFFASYFRNKKRVDKLIQYFHGFCSKPIGDAIFTYHGYEFRLVRIARGGGANWSRWIVSGFNHIFGFEFGFDD